MTAEEIHKLCHKFSCDGTEYNGVFTKHWLGTYFFNIIEGDYIKGYIDMDDMDVINCTYEEGIKYLIDELKDGDVTIIPEDEWFMLQVK